MPRYAETVEVCLFDESGEQRLILPGRTGTVHHGLVSGIGRGQEYGFRVSGRWDPASGIFSNPAKLLLDPYARSISRDLIANPALVIHRPRSEDRPDERDNSGFVPRSVVTDSRFDWQGDRPPRIPMADTVIYETHVRGLTMRHPSVPPELRGTYSGLVTEPVLEHLRALGVTTIELLPVHASVTEPWMQRRGLVNYWGYATAGYFAPNRRYCRRVRPIPVDEFKHMVKVASPGGLRGDPRRGLQPHRRGQPPGRHPLLQGSRQPGLLRARSHRPAPLPQLDRDRQHGRSHLSMGVAARHGQPPLLGPGDARRRVSIRSRHALWGVHPHVFDPRRPFFLSIQQDPVLRDVKLIAEPWDLGPDSYQLGNFPDWLVGMERALSGRPA